MKIFKFCQKFIFKYKGMFSIYIFLNIIIGILSVIIPLISAKIIDNLTYIKSKELLISYSIIYACFIAGNMIVGFLSSYLYIKIQTKSGYELNTYLINHLQNVSLSYFNNTDTVYLNQRINSDSNTVIVFCINVIINVMVNFLTLTFTSIMLIKINYRIAIILIILLATYIAIYGIFKKPLYKIMLKTKEAQSEFFSKLNEQLFNVKFIKIHSASKFFAKRLDNTFSSLISKLVSSQKLSYLYASCDTTIGLLAQLSIFLIGGFSIISGNMTIGFFTIMTSYFSMMMNSARYFFNLGKSYQDNLVSYNRIIEILAIKKQNNGDLDLNSIDKISLENISFNYGDKSIFNSYNIEFKKGKIYNLIGDNGAGKTTLINLILGLYINDYSGNIDYNDINIENIDMYKTKLKHIGITEQEPILIADTLLNNITFGQSYNNNKLYELIDILNLDKYISSLENGLDTIINEKSSNISGGEKQKISILREVLKNPDVLIFDEPTSALDSLSKVKFINYLQEVKLDKIIIIISHDEIIKNISDEIVKIN